MNERERGQTRRGGSDSYEWIQCLVAVLLLCVTVFSFLYRPLRVPGDSMRPTLQNGGLVFVSRLSREYVRGDIVALRVDGYRDEPIIKRVIAVAGQTVEIDFEAGVVYVDGEALDEPYVFEPVSRPFDYTEAVKVPEGCVFLLGDNRNNSQDSRSVLLGCVDTRYIIGRVVFRALPLSTVGAIYGAKEG